MDWVPSTNLEEEIVSLQPDHDFIFGGLTEPEVFYPRPKAHLEYAASQKTKDSQIKTQNHKLKVISNVQRIAGTKPLGEQPTVEDWNDNEHVERETIAMIRHFGYGPSVEEPLDEARTIATYPINEDMKVMRTGGKQMPVFFDEKFFKLKPRTSNTSSDLDSPGTTNSASADNSILSEMSEASGSSEHDKEKGERYKRSNSDKSGAGTSSQFESALEDEESYTTAYNSEGRIPTLNFYRSNYSERAQNKNSKKSATMGQQKMYTTRELYELKRQNR